MDILQTLCKGSRQTTLKFQGNSNLPFSLAFANLWDRPLGFTRQPDIRVSQASFECARVACVSW